MQSSPPLLKRGLKLKGGLKEGAQREAKKTSSDEFSGFLTPLKRFRVVFSYLWSGEHVFVHVFTAASREL